MKKLLLIILLCLSLTACGTADLSGIVSYDIDDTPRFSTKILKSAANEQTILTAAGENELCTYQWFLLGREIDDKNEWPLYVTATAIEQGIQIGFEYCANDALLMLNLPPAAENLAMYDSNGNYLKPIIQKNKKESTTVYCAIDKSITNGQFILSTAPIAAAEDNHCRLTIECVDIYANLDLFDLNKLSVLPADGVILAQANYPLQTGESAYDFLQRICQEQKIPMESAISSFNQSAYVEGIGNIYQLDGGSQSGWLYSVNGESPLVGASEYMLQSGDELCFYYICSFN